MMMHSVKKTACALTILATSISPALAESIDVKVIGTITPTACKPTLTGGGTIDYGVIPPLSLKKDHFNLLEERLVDFSLVCDSHAKVAVKAIDNRKNTAAVSDAYSTEFAPDPTKKIFGLDTAYVAGLGLDGKSKIGGYGMRIVADTVYADGIAVDGIWDISGGASNWLGPVTHGVLFYKNTPISTWTKKGEKKPLAFKTLSGKLGVQAYINKASELDLSKPVKLDGLTTLELVYL